MAAPTTRNTLHNTLSYTVLLYIAVLGELTVCVVALNIHIPWAW